jgi:hypothetical protein
MNWQCIELTVMIWCGKVVSSYATDGSAKDDEATESGEVYNDCH